MDETPKALQDLVDAARDLALAGNLRACHDVTASLIGRHMVADIKAAMRASDVDRVVWHGPIPADAVGARGWPLVEARYEIHSDIYGHGVRLPYALAEEEFAREFVEAAVIGYERGLLHDLGHVVFDKLTGGIGFLLTIPIDPDESVDEDLVAATGNSHGVPVMKMAWSHRPLEADGAPGMPILAAFVSDIAKFDTVKDLADSMQSALYGGANASTRAADNRTGASA
jgi:hypothetical protein